MVSILAQCFIDTSLLITMPSVTIWLDRLGTYDYIVLETREQL